ncbi:hypothetical protein [Nocardia sp. NPDC006630]|uniref:hypothetical protein n=1 Tax=Nocardia sp. NPDC006630 TaxID=3157181 RepID=UPI00339F62C0
MTAPALLCQYCLHRNSGADSLCAHCGAPLREVGAALLGTAAAATAVGVAPPLSAVAPLVERAVSAVGQWWVTLVGIAALLAAVVTVAVCCSPGLPPIGQPTVRETLPGSLRAAATCGGASQAVVQCVIPAGNGLLFGGIVGGRDLTFSVQVEDPARLSDDVRRWRAAGPAVIADGTLFVAIGPEAAVWYADTRTGVRMETATFVNRVAAQTFLIRSGLAA